MRYEIELRHSEPIVTIVVRGRAQPSELAEFVSAACGEVWSFMRAAGLPRPGRHLALYLDEQGTIEVGAEVNALTPCPSPAYGRGETADTLGCIV
jgi:hypothetical protein